MRSALFPSCLFLLPALSALAVDPPAKINVMAPVSYPAGRAAFKLSVGGSPMSPDTVVYWNGEPRPTRYVNTIAVDADIAAADIATPGTAVVTVYRPGVGLSNPLVFQIADSATSSPVITGLSPAVVAAGSGTQQITVQGALFTSDSVVRFNGDDRPTTLVDSKNLRVSLSAADLAKAGIANLSVHRPNLTPSNNWRLTIGSTPLAPTLTEVHPAAVLAGSPDITLVLTGKSFTASDIVRWNGSQRSSTFVSSEELRVTIPASDLTAVGTAAIQVYQALAGYMNGWTFHIDSKAGQTGGSGGTGGGGGSGGTGVTVSSVSPAVILAGTGAQNLTVYGTGFALGAKGFWNGVEKQTTYLSATQVKVALTATDTAAAGTGVVTVSIAGSGSASREVSITSFSALPGVPVTPSPEDYSSNVSANAVLAWSAVNGAVSYDVYLGTSVSPPFAANVLAPTYTPPVLQPGVTYYWRVAAKNAAGSSNSFTWRFTTAPLSTMSYGFFTVSPCRVVDTRTGQGTSGAFGPPSMAANSTRSFPLPVGRCALPATAKAYSVNVTVVPKEPLGYLTLWPSGQSMPVVSTLNSFHGGLVANAAIVPAGVDGGINAYVTNAADVIIDVNGYFDNASGALSFYAPGSCRAVDTRSAQLGLTGSPFMSAGAERSFPLLAGTCPLYGARAYSLNATVVPRGPLGYLTLWPTGSARPLVSTLNSLDGAVVANAAVTPAGTDAALSAYVTDATDLILDINGYFGLPGYGGEMKYVPLTPCRAADTRQGGPGALTANETRGFAIAGRCGVPLTAKALALNVTVVPPGPLGYLALWPAGQAQPAVSTLNSNLGRVVANAAIARAGVAGAVNVYVTDATHVILDVNGYFE